jgi:hypothetical protein
MGEVVSMMEAAGFRVVEAYYSIVNDLTLVDAELEGYPRAGFFDLVRLFVKRPSRLNALRLLAYPLVRLRPSLRQLIVVVGVKAGEPKLEAVERWGRERERCGGRARRSPFQAGAGRAAESLRGEGGARPGFPRDAAERAQVLAVSRGRGREGAG